MWHTRINTTQQHFQFISNTMIHDLQSSSRADQYLSTLTSSVNCPLGISMAPFTRRFAQQASTLTSPLLDAQACHTNIHPSTCHQQHTQIVDQGKPLPPTPQHPALSSATIAAYTRAGSKPPTPTSSDIAISHIRVCGKAYATTVKAITTSKMRLAGRGDVIHWEHRRLRLQALMRKTRVWV